METFLVLLVMMLFATHNLDDDKTEVEAVEEPTQIEVVAEKPSEAIVLDKLNSSN